jgi:hypothetical protein
MACERAPPVHLIRIPGKSVDRVPREVIHSHPWIPAFLAALETNGIVSLAARQAGINHSTAQRTAKSEPSFAVAWAEALDLSIATLEAEARRRALEGVRKPLVCRGEVVGRWIKDGKEVRKGTEAAEWEPIYVHEYSDSNAQFLLRAHRPEVYGERSETRVVGSGRAELFPSTRVARRMAGPRPSRSGHAWSRTAK